MTRYHGTRVRAGAGVAALLLSGAGLLATATAADAATPPVSCGGMTAAAATAAGYNVFDFSAQPGPMVFTSTTGTGNDWIYGTPAADTLSGSAGNDIICGGANSDFIFGNSGNDELHGEAGSDTIYGDDFGSGNGAASDGDDLIFGGPESDTMLGNGGRDDIRGGAGASDSGDGGNGADTCKVPETEARISC